MKELLKKYQNNELNAADTEGIEKRLIEQAVERQLRKKWAKILADNGIDRSKIPAFADKDPATNPIFMAAKRTSQRRFIMGIAASLALIACFWWWDVNSTSAVDLANSALFNEHFAAPSVRMGQNDDIKSWDDAKNAYRDAHFEDAAKLIEAIPTPSIEQQFYLALSHTYSIKPDYDKASAGFKHIIENGNGNFEDESRWYYALCSIKLGRNDEAKLSLQTLIKGQAWKAKEVQALLYKLN
jgi:hypothetical protein